MINLKRFCALTIATFVLFLLSFFCLINFVPSVTAYGENEVITLAEDSTESTDGYNWKGSTLTISSTDKVYDFYIEGDATITSKDTASTYVAGNITCTGALTFSDVNLSLTSIYVKGSIVAEESFKVIINTSAYAVAAVTCLGEDYLDGIASDCQSYAALTEKGTYTEPDSTYDWDYDKWFLVCSSDNLAATLVVLSSANNAEAIATNAISGSSEEGKEEEKEEEKTDSTIVTDDDNKTVTLNGATQKSTGTSVVTVPDGYSLMIKGENTITYDGNSAESEEFNGWAIDFEGDATVSGGGSLTVKVTNGECAAFGSSGSGAVSFCSCNIAVAGEGIGGTQYVYYGTASSVMLCKGANILTSACNYGIYAKSVALESGSKFTFNIDVEAKDSCVLISSENAIKASYATVTGANVVVDGTTKTVESNYKGDNVISFDNTVAYLSDGEISGMAGYELNDTELTITFYNGTISGFLVGQSFDDYLLNLPSGLSSDVTAVAGDSLTVKISGTPTPSGNSAVSLTGFDWSCGSVSVNIVEHEHAADGNWQCSVSPTEETKGAISCSCTACSGTITEELPTLNEEDYSYEVTVVATCMQFGKCEYVIEKHGQTFTFSKEIAKLAHTVSGIAVHTNPNKTAYTVGEVFDSDGMIIYSTCKSGHEIEKVSFLCDTSTALTLETKYVIITAEIGGQMYSCNCDITVQDKPSINCGNAFGNYGGEYDGKEHTIAVDKSKISAGNGATFTVYFSSDNKTWREDNIAFINYTADAAVVYWKVVADGCDDAFGSNSVSIKKRKVSVTVDDKSSVEGRELSALTYTATGFLDGDESKITLIKEDGDTVGTYKITATCADENYELTVKDGVYTILAAKITSGDGAEIDGGDGFGENVTFSAVVMETYEISEVTLSSLSKDEEIAAVYDLSLYEGGTKAQPSGCVTVKLALPQNIAAEDVSCMLYVDDEGVGRKYDVTPTDDGRISFETDHFSYWAIVLKKEAVATEDIQSQTDDTQTDDSAKAESTVGDTAATISDNDGDNNSDNNEASTEVKAEAEETTWTEVFSSVPSGTWALIIGLSCAAFCGGLYLLGAALYSHGVLNAKLFRLIYKPLEKKDDDEDY